MDSWWLPLVVWCVAFGAWLGAYVYLNRRVTSLLRHGVGPVWHEICVDYGLTAKDSRSMHKALLWSGVYRGQVFRIGTYHKLLSKFFIARKPVAFVVIKIGNPRCRLVPKKPRMLHGVVADESFAEPWGIVSFGIQVMRAAGQLPPKTSEELLSGVLYDGAAPMITPEVEASLLRWVSSGRAYLSDEGLSLAFWSPPDLENAAEVLRVAVDDAMRIADWVNGRLDEVSQAER